MWTAREALESHVDSPGGSREPFGQPGKLQITIWTAREAAKCQLSCWEAPPFGEPGGSSYPNGSFLPPWCLADCPIDLFLPPWCLASYPNGSFLPPWCLADFPIDPFLLPPWFPASLVPPGASQSILSCLPGASQTVQLILSCLPGASQAVQTGLSCLPGASQAVQMVLSCLPVKGNPALGAAFQRPVCAGQPEPTPGFAANRAVRH